MRLVTSYVNPDLDGVACAFALAELLRAQGQTVACGLFGDPQQEALWMLDTFAIPRPSDGTVFLKEAETITIVDVSSVNDIQSVMPLDRITDMIDHHEVSCEADLPNLTRKQIELVGSCATLIAERMHAAAYEPSCEAARLLSGAIASNTVNFRSTVTTDRDRAMFTWLATFAELPADFVERMFTAKSDLGGDRLRLALENDTATKRFGNANVLIFQLEIAGVTALLDARRDEILDVMQRVAVAEEATHTFLNALDILAGTTTILVPDEESAALIFDALGRDTHDGRSTVDGLVLRKQIVPLLKAKLGSIH